MTALPTPMGAQQLPGSADQTKQQPWRLINPAMITVHASAVQAPSEPTSGEPQSDTSTNGHVYVPLHPDNVIQIRGLVRRNAADNETFVVNIYSVAEEYCNLEAPQTVGQVGYSFDLLCTLTFTEGTKTLHTNHPWLTLMGETTIYYADTIVASNDNTFGGVSNFGTSAGNGIETVQFDYTGCPALMVAGTINSSSAAWNLAIRTL